MAIVTPTDRHKSVSSRFVIEVFGGVFVLSRCFLDFSVGVGAFVIGVSQISSFFSLIVQAATRGHPFLRVFREAGPPFITHLGFNLQPKDDA